MLVTNMSAANARHILADLTLSMSPRQKIAITSQ